MYFAEKPDVKDVFLYLRKSSDEKSGKQLRSIRDQRQDCYTLAKRLNLNIIEEFKDEASARKPHNRPEFDRMLKEMKIKNPKIRRADGILSWHPNRLSRNALESGVIIQMLDDDLIKDLFFVAYIFHNDSSGKEHLAMEFARAKSYSDTLSDVVLRGVKNREADGAILYGMKFGYTKKREHREANKSSLFPIPDSTNFPILKAILTMGKRGKSIDEIHANLIRNNMKSTSGRIPNRSSIHRYLNDPFNFGKSVINKGLKNEREIDLRHLTAPDGTPFIPAWTEEEYWQYQRRIRGEIPKPKLSKQNHPLRGGFIRCGKNGECAMYAAERTIKRAGGKTIKQLGYEQHNRNVHQPRIRAEIVFNAIAADLQGGLGLTDKEYHQFRIEAQQYADKRRIERRMQRKRLTEMTTLAERDLEQLEAEKAALVRQNEYDQDARKRIEKQKKTLKNELQHNRVERKNIDSDFEDDLFTYKTFLELSTNADVYWLNANHEEKHKIAEILLLNLIVEGQKVRSITYKSPFAEWIKKRNVANGGASGTKLEPLFEWLFTYIELQPELFRPIVEFYINVACTIAKKIEADEHKRVAVKQLNLDG